LGIGETVVFLDEIRVGIRETGDPFALLLGLVLVLDHELHQRREDGGAEVAADRVHFEV
jgi:hypothetical protein